MDDVNTIYGKGPGLYIPCFYGKGPGVYIPCLDGVVKRAIYLDDFGFCGIRHIVWWLAWGIATIEVSS